MDSNPTKRPSRTRLLATVLAVCALSLVIGAQSASGIGKVVLFSFGSEGTEGGQLSGAFGAAINSTGNGPADPGDLYVSERGNNRVSQFDEEGNFIRAWGKDVDSSGGSGGEEVCTAPDCQAGSAGTAEGEFDNPTGGVAVNQSNGHVYVLDNKNQRVQQFDGEGGFIRTWGWGVDDGSEEFQVCTAGCQSGIRGEHGGQFKLTSSGGTAGGGNTGIAVDGSGNVYVAEQESARVQMFSPAGAFVRTWGYDTIAEGKPGDTGTGFEICTSTVAGDCKAGKGSSTPGPGQFSGSSRMMVAADSAGNAYVVDAGNGAKRVQKFAPSGSFDSILPIQFNAFFGVATDPLTDHVFVAQTKTGSSNRPIEEFDPAGVLQDVHAQAADIASPYGIAINAAGGAHDGEIYVVDFSSSEVNVLGDAPPAIPLIDPVTELDAHTATLTGTVEPGEGGDTTYRFEYREEGASAWTKVPAEDVFIGDGTGGPGDPDDCPNGDPQVCNVSQQIGNLAAKTTYEARLVATNSFGVVVTDGPVSFTTLAAPPEIATAASVASATGAELHAMVNPQKSEVTECRFDWGPTASYGSSVPCEALPGSGGKGVLVSAALEGLTEGATYYYRLVATNEAGTSFGEARQIEIGLQLPDDRAWEMVSPPDKNGGNVMVDTTRSRAPRGLAPGQQPAFAFSSLATFADAYGTGIATDYLAVRDRTVGRWLTHAITPPQDSSNIANVDKLYVGEFSADLSSGIARVSPSRSLLTPDSHLVSRVSNMYLRTDLREPGAGAYSLLTSCPLCEALEVPHEYVGGQYELTHAGASSDFSHVAFSTNLNLTADAGGTEPKLYEWVNGSLALAGRVPAGGDSCDDSAGPACAVAPRSQSPITAAISSHPVSSDGSRVVFQTSAGQSGQLYLRIGGHGTVRINASEKAVPDPSLAATFWSATPDTSRILFTTTEQLVETDTDDCSDLYRYQVAPLDPVGMPLAGVSHLTRLSVDEEPSDGSCADAVGAMGSSDDGETTYFFAHGQLEAGQPLGDDLLYRWHQGDLRYIGRAGPGDGKRNIPATTLESSTTGAGFPWDTQGRVTSDGEHALFASSSGTGLTGFDHGSSGDCTGGCNEFYLYKASANGGAGKLTCVSCNPRGAPSTSESSIYTRILMGAAAVTDHVNQPLSDDGRYVFFDTGERLIPTDTNGRRDVYRYDSISGQLALISSGQSGASSFFLDATPDGRDVFFGTAERLSGWDVDRAYDAYDARIGGGLPEPPPLAQECEGDACQPPVPDLDDPTPSTATFRGRGNQVLQGGVRRCRASGGQRRLKVVRRQVSQLRRRAGRASGDRSRTLRRKARRLERSVRRLQKRTRSCRRRGAGPDRAGSRRPNHQGRSSR